MTEPHPVFSIITPTYKRPELLKRAIQSAVDQTFTNWEMCIVDNFSPDDTLEVINQFHDPRIKIAQIHNNGIIAKSRNTAIAMATGKYLAFLDADDWWTADKLGRALSELESGADFFYHDMQIVTEAPDIKNWPTLGSQALDPDNTADALAAQGGVIPNSSVVLRRTLSKHVGPISEDPDLVAVEDYDYWLRCALAEGRFQFSADKLGYYWNASSSMTQAYRTLRWGATLREKYPEYAFPWLSYTMARAHCTQGQYKEAHMEIIALTKGGLPLRLRGRFALLKIFVMWKIATQRS